MKTSETIAGIGLQASADEVRAALGEPEETDTPERDRATKKWLWHWTYFVPENALTLELESDRKGGAFRVRAIVLHGPGVTTGRGLGVGCTREDVRRAYPELEFEEIEHEHEDIAVLRSGPLLFRFSGKYAAPIVLGAPSDFVDLSPATFD